MFVACLASVGVLGGFTASQASAWPWSPTVKVVGTVAKCGPSASSGWGWFQTNGEGNWMTWGRGSTFGFTLRKVSTSGSITRISWGVGRCQATVFRNITRPTYGDTVNIGFLG
ncbi:MAG: hypothetical protein AB7I08_02225 [Thermoleophilia bacterium]